MPKSDFPRLIALALIAVSLLLLGCAQQQPDCSSGASSSSGYSPIIPLAPYGGNPGCPPNASANATNSSIAGTGSGDSGAGINISKPSMNYTAPEPAPPENASSQETNSSLSLNSTLESNATYNAPLSDIDSSNASANVSLRVVYFYSHECPFCLDVAPFVNKTAADFASWGVAIEQHDILSNSSEFVLYNGFAGRYGVPANLRVIPMVFINSTYIYTNETIRETLRQSIDSCLESGSCANPYDFAA